MELVDVVALCHFSDSRVGSFTRKQRIQVPRDHAERLEKAGLVSIVGAKTGPIAKAEEPKTEAKPKKVAK